MNEINIHLFATLRDYVGAKTLKMEIPVETTVGKLKDMLVEKHPRLAKVRNSMLAAINREYAADEQKIPENAEIALFPPVSGG